MSAAGTASGVRLRILRWSITIALPLPLTPRLVVDPDYLRLRRCLPSDARFGAASVSVDCFGQNELVLAPGASPHASFFTASWFESQTCRQGECPLGHFTVVEAQQSICQTGAHDRQSAQLLA